MGFIYYIDTFTCTLFTTALLHELCPGRITLDVHITSLCRIFIISYTRRWHLDAGVWRLRWELWHRFFRQHRGVGGAGSRPQRRDLRRGRVLVGRIQRPRAIARSWKLEWKGPVVRLRFFDGKGTFLRSRVVDGARALLRGRLLRWESIVVRSRLFDGARLFLRARVQQKKAGSSPGRKLSRTSPEWISRQR